jgi:hypothetical protein
VASKAVSNWVARALFLNQAARDFYVEWEEVAAATVGQLRLSAARHLDDAELASLVGGLCRRSADFRRLWDTGEVEQRTYGAKTLQHPRSAC